MHERKHCTFEGIRYFEGSTIVVQKFGIFFTTRTIDFATLLYVNSQ